MAGLIEGKVAIVTGAGRGIGRAEALSLASEGCRVVVNDYGLTTAGESEGRSPAEEVVAEIKKLGGDAVAHFGDVASMESGEAMVRLALDTWGRLDILVNNAGFVQHHMIYNQTESEWDATIAVHLKGHFTVTKHACIVFRQQHSGRIVCTSSPTGLGDIGQSAYAAAKEGIVGFVRSLALDMGRYGVTANAIRPVAGTRLSMSDDLVVGARRRAAAGMPSGNDGLQGEELLARFASWKPEYVAAFVTFLCTDAAANVNGRDFIVRGEQLSLMSIPSPLHTISREGGWTPAELVRVFPGTIGRELTNPSPPPEGPAA